MGLIARGAGEGVNDIQMEKKKIAKYKLPKAVTPGQWM